MKQSILIKYLKKLIDDNSSENYKVKAEYSTNDNDKRVVIVQEQPREKQVFYGNIEPLYNYYNIEIFGLSIKECKDLSLIIGSLIGQNIIEGDYQLMFIQNINPQFLEYKDIRRVGYTLTLQTIINKIKED